MEVVSAVLDPFEAIHTVYGIARYPDTGAESMQEEADKPGPTSPVLFLKPRNTFLRSGGVVLVPPDMPALQVSAALGLVMGREVRRVSAPQALDAVAGVVLALDVTEVNAGIFRPPIREKCRDGFLPLGPEVLQLSESSELASLEIALSIDSEPVASSRLRDTLAKMREALSDISSFMTLRAGDVMLVARTDESVLAPVGSRITVSAPGFQPLTCSLMQQTEEARP